MKKHIACFNAALILMWSVLAGIPSAKAYALEPERQSTEDVKVNKQEAEEPKPVVQEAEEPESVVQEAEEPKPGVQGTEEQQPGVQGTEEPKPGVQGTEEQQPGNQESSLAAASEELQAILAEHDVMALVYLEPVLPLWEDTSFDSEAVAEVTTGQTVFIRDVLVDEEEIQWVLVETYFGEESYTGYIPRYYLACSDEDFLQWEQVHFGDHFADMTVYAEREGQYADIEAFPESYREALYRLKAQHPQWIFVPMETGQSWNNVINGEMQGDRSLIYKTVQDHFKRELYDDGNWYYCTEGILKYYMDPRNWLTQDGIFQFELLTYNRTYHTEAAVDAFLNNTFMNNTRFAPGTNKTFAHIFTEVGADQNVSPFHLASRVFQEQQGGTSDLISGTYEGANGIYRGYYNYFNVRASGTSRQEIIENGLAYAKSRDWSDAEKSIRGGVQVIALQYIREGQDTLYLQKYNVNSNSRYGLYNHQYMQNIAAPSSEGNSVMKMYQSTNALDNTFVFKIPVYGNMPEEPCPVPPRPVNGWREENGGRYWYENDVKQGTEGRGKEIYDPNSDAWYWLDAVEGGKMAADKDVYLESGSGDGKWVRYDANGRMVKGEDQRNGGWYRFDEYSGAMVKGWYEVKDNNGKVVKKYYYDRKTGQMVHGQTVVDGQSLYFDPVTGVLADMTWVWMDGVEYWYENGIRQGYDPYDSSYRGKEIYDPGTDAWYWLDNVDRGKKAVSKDVYQESNGGKWVRYDAQGHMVKGWDYTDYGTYYFDPATGAMAKGEVEVDEEIHFFDVATGVQIW